MSFSAESFIFDGIPSEQFGLMLYSFENSNTKESELSPNIEIIGERINRRHDSIHYGVSHKEPLTFPLTFGSATYLDKYDVDAIGNWLTSHKQYKILELFQPDMGYVRYKCIINRLRTISIADMPVAFTCDVICDSPFGYACPVDFSYTLGSSGELKVLNKSNCQDYFLPYLILKPKSGTSEITITNKTDNNRVFKLSKIPTSGNPEIHFNNKDQIITSNSSVNFYENFNHHFLRLVRGQNLLAVTGSCDLLLRCEFLMRVGG